MRASLHITSSLALAGLAGCVGQLDPESCAWEYIHHAESAPADLGNGLTAQEENHVGYHDPSDYWGAERVFIRDCASGRWVRVEKSAQNDSGEYVHDHRTAVDRMLEAAAKLPADAAMQFLIEESERLGVLRNSGEANGEDCACRVFYPELRGDKKPYEAS